MTDNYISTRPKTERELFNLRHAQARNVVERIFGVFKRRFQIFSAPPEYSMAIQAKLVQALCVVHNFIRIHDPQDMPMRDTMDDDLEGSDDDNDNRQNFGSLGTMSSPAHRSQAEVFRDAIAKEMFADYKRELNRRGRSL